MGHFGLWGWLENSEMSCLFHDLPHSGKKKCIDITPAVEV